MIHSYNIIVDILCYIYNVPQCDIIWCNTMEYYCVNCHCIIYIYVLYAVLYTVLILYKTWLLYIRLYYRRIVHAWLIFCKRMPYIVWNVSQNGILVVDTANGSGCSVRWVEVFEKGGPMLMLSPALSLMIRSGISSRSWYAILIDIFFKPRMLGFGKLFVV
jgi:hypothetical protein